ncbi:MAG: hypothetical protein HY748_01945 [Elusimicrobia bacterium]|nr:hypothetical protein [Elusimicrobiota bacterium]
MERRRFVVFLLCISLLNAAAGPAASAGVLGQGPAASGERASSSESDLLQSLSDVLEQSLSRSQDSDGLTLAVQGLELDSLDLETSRGRSAASRALLRSVENPRAVEDLRAFVRRHASHPEAARALARLRQWENLLSIESSRTALLAGLSGSNDLASSMGGTPKDSPAAAASASGMPPVSQPGWTPVTGASHSGAIASVVFILPTSLI